MDGKTLHDLSGLLEIIPQTQEDYFRAIKKISEMISFANEEASWDGNEDMVGATPDMLNLNKMLIENAVIKFDLVLTDKEKSDDKVSFRDWYKKLETEFPDESQN